MFAANTKANTKMQYMLVKGKFSNPLVHIYFRVQSLT